ncbi:MAG: hypothetical protein IH905_07775 [Proteobacteria bacterium]|nr:hypothetical protein [Pseudomonadota bacterium]
MTDDKTSVQAGTQSLFIPLALLIGGGIAFGSVFRPTASPSRRDFRSFPIRSGKVFSPGSDS